MSSRTRATSSSCSVDSIRESVPSSWRSINMPAWLRHREGTFSNARGQSLSYLALFPPVKTPLRGIVVYLHGLGEHSRRHFHAYEQLCEHGYGAVAYDLLGHGESDLGRHRMRAHAEKFQYFVDDTNAFITFAKESVIPEMIPPQEPQDDNTEARAARPLVPLILCGVSYGSLVALHTQMTEQHAFDAVVLVSPAVSIEWRPLLRIQAFFARPMSAVIPKVRVVPAVKADLLCRDPAYIEDYDNDPLTVSEHMTMRVAEQSMRACAALQKEARFTDPKSAFCELPILFMMGSADKVTSLPSAVEFFEKIRNKDREFKVFRGMFHALFDDPEKDEVFDHLFQWLEKRFPDPEQPLAAKTTEAGGLSGGRHGLRKVSIYEGDKIIV
ncbi:Serine protease family s33 [Globisporangium polare]